ncbi:MAG TPA: hypothetical protein ENH82_09680 [bacterium]|nr:hypothetical protein [bacterium]
MPLGRTITKKCCKCGETKDLSKFYDVLSSKCISCARDYCRRYATAHRPPRKRPIIKRVYCPKTARYIVTPEEREKRRLINKATRYGLTVQEYLKMLKDQNSSCAICSRKQSELSYELHIDHNHTTNKVRELLCARCNGMVGHIESKLYPLAIKYLKKHNI